MRRLRSLSLALLWISVPVQAQRPAAAEDVATPEAIVTAAYDALARAPGAPFQWDRFRSLLLDDATLIPNTEQNGGAFRAFSPEAWIESIDAWYAEHVPIGSPQDRGFQEEAVHTVVHRYGDVAQAFSTYQKHFWEDDRILGRGINSFQLVQHDGRWWIVSIVWDEETGAGPIPGQYGGEE